MKMSAGLLVISAGLIPLTTLTSGTSAWQVAGGLFVAGIGTGVVNATLGREAVASVPPTLAGTGSGINNTSRYVGSALGVTVITIIAVRPSGDLVAGWNTAAVVCIALSVVGALVVYVFHRADANRTSAGSVKAASVREGAAS
jgi:sugar phosphate permease